MVKGKGKAKKVTQEKDIVKHVYTRAQLIRMKKDELAEVALGFNINPRRSQNKEVLADAIILVQNGEDNATDENGLTEKQELFCQLYATDREFFGNGTQAYIEAYDVDVSTPGGYRVAQASASRLLSNVIILKRIDEIMEYAVLNDSYVDKKMAFWIMQESNPMASIAAIKEYNKVKKRTVDAAMNPLALIQNNYNVSIKDDRGRELSEKYTQFMLEATTQEIPAEKIKNARSAADYQKASQNT